MNAILDDLKLALRSLWRTRLVTVLAVVTLALGIGASAAIFAVMQGIVLKPLPYPDADRQVRLTSFVPGAGEVSEWNLSSAQYFQLKQLSRTLEKIGVWQVTSKTLQLDDRSRRVVPAIVSAEMIQLLGAEVVAGRLFAVHDDAPAAAPTVMLSYAYWQQQLSGDPAVIGRTLRLGQESYEIIGVLPADTRLPGAPGVSNQIERPDVWTTARLDASGPFSNAHVYMAMGLLGDGVGIAEAQEEMDAITQGLAEAYPDVYGDDFIDQYGFETRLTPLKDYVLGNTGKHLWLLAGAVMLVLLIALANVANMFMARIEARHADYSLRSVLGANLFVILRSVFAESMLLAICGGMLALLAASIGVRMLVAAAPESLARADNIALDASVILFVVIIVLLVTLALTSMVLIRFRQILASGIHLRDSQRATAGLQQQRTRSALVAGQVALALVLLITAGLLLQSFSRLQQISPGFAPQGVVRMQIHLSRQNHADHASIWRFYRDLINRVNALPDVTAVGAGNPLPLSGEYACWAQDFQDQAVAERLRAVGGTQCADLVVTAPGYFETLGVPLLAGRTLTMADLDNPDVGAVVVSRHFAERYWPGEEALGKAVRPLAAASEVPHYYRVVGVVGDLPASSLEGERASAIYYPMTPVPAEGFPVTPALHLHLLIKSSHARPAALVPVVRSIVNQLDSSAAVGPTGSMSEDIRGVTGRVSFSMNLLMLAASVALFLAAVGVYGMIAFLVSRRTSEIGIRMALGAVRQRIMRLVMAGSMKMVMLGMLAGLVFAVFTERLLRGMYFGLQSGSPMVYALATALLLGVALIAAYIPARHAARIQPIEALRHD